MSAREETLARARANRPVAAGSVPRDYRTTAPADVDLIELLVDRLVDYRATVRRCALAAVPGVVAELLGDDSAAVVPSGVPDEWLSAYPGKVLRDEPPLAVADLDAPGVAVLTGCAVAVAQTGTIILDTGPGQGRRALTLVPDHHLCVLPAEQVVYGLPEALARLAAPTRPLTLVSGPSATSDIELDRVEGVHGPRRLDVVITDRLE